MKCSQKCANPKCPTDQVAVLKGVRIAFYAETRRELGGALSLHYVFSMAYILDVGYLLVLWELKNSSHNGNFMLFLIFKAFGSNQR